MSIISILLPNYIYLQTSIDTLMLMDMKETLLITLTSKEFVDEIKLDMLKISYSEIQPSSQVYCELLDEVTEKVLKGEKEWKIKEYLKSLIK